MPRVPRLPVGIARGAVVEDPAIDRPRPSPARREARIVRVRIVAPCHLISLLGETTGVDPAAARRLAVVAQLRETVELLPRPQLYDGSVLGIGYVFNDIAVDLARDFFRARRVDELVGPVQAEDRLGEGAALLAVHVAQAQEQVGHY